MNTTENQNDPYAHLKLAWEEGRRIRYKSRDFPWSDWYRKSGPGSPTWDLLPECYEIEPLPADKWAAEKAALAHGKKIECRNRASSDQPWTAWFTLPATEAIFFTHGLVEYRIAPDPALTYHTTAVVQQRREGAAAVNAAMNPAPAILRPLTAEEKNATGLSDESLSGALTTGPLDDSPQANELRRAFKDAPAITETTMEALRQAGVEAPAGMTDEQLCTIATVSLEQTDPLSSCEERLLTMVVAVREAVEKEQAEEIARLTAIIEQAIEMVNTPGTTKGNLPQAINAKIMQCDEFHDATLKKLDAAKTEIERLKGEYSSLLQAYKKLEATEQKTRDAYDRAMTDCVTLRAEHNALTAEFAKANAELERLRWRSPEIRPQPGDADKYSMVNVDLGEGAISNFNINKWPWESYNIKAWRPFCPPPALTAEEVERERFEKAYRKAYPDADDDIFSRSEDGSYYNLFVNGMWKLWNDFSAAKEGQK